MFEVKKFLFRRVTALRLRGPRSSKFREWWQVESAIISAHLTARDNV